MIIWILKKDKLFKDKKCYELKSDETVCTTHEYILKVICVQVWKKEQNKFDNKLNIKDASAPDDKKIQSYFD